MSEIKNKIITISGEPVSGKSTVVKTLKEKYESMGYNVHVISTGYVFREVIMQEYLRMYPDRKNANLADVQADEAFAHKRNEIDKLVDEEMRKKGIEINSQERPNDVYIIDSRLAWHNIPASYAIRLTVDEKIAGERAFKDKTRGPEDRYKTVEEAIQKTRERKLGEIKRYKEKYGIDLSDPQNYDLIVDTAYSNTDELADIIIAGEESYRKGIKYPKNWASPVHFISMQKIKDCDSKERKKKFEMIKQGKYNLIEEPLYVAENNGVKILLDGNHRCHAGLMAGKTLFPYIITHKDDEIAKQREQELYEDPTLESTYDWAEAIEYYGGSIGQIERLKGFKVTDLLSLIKSTFLRKKMRLDQQGEDGR